MTTKRHGSAVAALSFAALCAGAVLAPALAGCPEGFKAPVGAAFEGTELKVAIDPSEPPMIFRDKDDPEKIVGFHADLIEDVAACLDTKVRFEVLDFNGIIPAVSSGRADLQWTGMYYRPERAKVVDFVIYMKSATGAVTQAAKAAGITSLDKICGLRGAVMTGAVDEALMTAESAKCTAAGKPAIEISSYQNTAALVRAIENDRADVALFEILAARQLVADRPALAMPFSVSTGLLVGGSTRKGNEALRDAVAAAVRHLQASGETKRLMAKWNLDPVLEEPVSVRTE